MIAEKNQPFVFECDKILDSAEDSDFSTKLGIKSNPHRSSKLFAKFFQGNIDHTSFDGVEFRIEYFFYIVALKFFESQILFFNKSFPNIIKIVDSFDPSIRVYLKIISIKSCMLSKIIKYIGRNIIDAISTERFECFERCFDDMLFSIISFKFFTQSFGVLKDISDRKSSFF